MPDDQQQPAADAPLSGKEIYDAIMRTIDPELTSDQLPLLAAKYAGETPEQKAERMKRYKVAFDKYDAAFEQYMQALTSDVHAIKREARVTAEQKDREEEQKKESDLLSQMQAL
jgi:esterase/lipase